MTHPDTEVTIVSRKNHVVQTSGRLLCDAKRAWEKVCFYEHIATKPSLLLRTALPVPMRTTGSYRKVGDVSRCMYSDGGYLTKQIRHLVDGKRIEFDIIEQSIRYAGKINLNGGWIELEPHTDGTCSVHMLTRYELRRLAVLIPRAFIDYVVSAMHGIVIRDMLVRLQCANVASMDHPIPRERCSLPAGYARSEIA